MNRERGIKIRKTVLFTGYSCNNRCGFCVDYDKRHISDCTTADLLRQMARARAEGSDYLELIGGEATIRRDFPSLVRAARKMGFREVVTATNGRSFSNALFAREVVRSGITAVIFSIHGPTGDAHDRLTQVPGSFRQLMRGIENLRSLGFSSIYANTTVVAQNYRLLPDMARLYLSLALRGVEIIFVDPTEGGARRSFLDFVPRISEAAPWMRRCLEIGRRSGTRDWSVRYVPLCHFLGYEDQVSETTEREVFHTVHLAPDFENRDVSGSRAAVARGKPAACSGCRLDDACEGIWKEYLRRYGSSEMKPV